MLGFHPGRVPRQSRPRKRGKPMTGAPASWCLSLLSFRPPRAVQRRSDVDCGLGSSPRVRHDHYTTIRDTEGSFRRLEHFPHSPATEIHPMKSKLKLITCVLFVLAARVASAATLPPGFSESVIASGISSPTA